MIQFGIQSQIWDFCYIINANCWEKTLKYDLCTFSIFGSGVVTLTIWDCMLPLKVRLLGIFPFNKLVPGHNFSWSRTLMDPITELSLYFEVYSIQSPNF
jgi:hypothetical protein